MKSLQERVGEFRPARVDNVVRNGQSYEQSYKFTKRVLKLCKVVFNRLPDNGQAARHVRNLALWSLRQYHEYCIEGHFGAHYRQVGLKAADKKEFEHVLPVSLARDLMFFDMLTIDEAMNIPTCFLSKHKHRQLAKLKLGDSTPDIYWFWKRYADLGIIIETHDGTPVDFSKWSLDTHYQYFKH